MDPERGEWQPGRRSFLFMAGAALVGTALPGWGRLNASGLWVRGSPYPPLYALRGQLRNLDERLLMDALCETFSKDRVFAPLEAKLRRDGRLFYAGGQW